MSHPFGQDFPGTQLNAILYARVSSAEQAKSDLSIPDQMESMRKHCRQAGIAVAHEFSDARSGRSLDGRSLGEILDIIKSGTVTINLLIVHSFSRLARESYEAEWLWRELEKLGVQIVSITQPIEDSPTGGLLRQMINVFDEYTSNEIAKHVTRTMKFNAEHGFWNGGLPPFGYVAAVAGMRGKKVKKKLAVDPNEAEDVRLIFTLYLDGDGKTGPMGVKKVAQWMNSHGHSRRGRNWTTGQLHRLLTDAVYVGDYLFGKKKPKDSQVIVKVPAIIDAPTFDKVQARLREHHPILKAPRQVSSPVLLTGTARCGHCGGGMVLATGKSNRYRYYTCSNHKRKGKSVCQGQNVPMEELDKIVTDTLILALDDTERSQAVLCSLYLKLSAMGCTRFSISGENKPMKRGKSLSSSARRRIVTSTQLPWPTMVWAWMPNDSRHFVRPTPIIRSSEVARGLVDFCGLMPFRISMWRAFSERMKSSSRDPSISDLVVRIRYTTRTWLKFLVWLTQVRSLL
ncbi:recombinase family protein [Epibacterium ulvae]|uniref:recombinase family protein n=1 Tax=Epibacterium ulvae TaxID=1156985 RepID=UPI001BFC4DBF|nr:recombinase family protein [Epibacterium ulvae]MBT8154634.1 recombinase family protein [Epibacterium ulvae]